LTVPTNPLNILPMSFPIKIFITLFMAVFVTAMGAGTILFWRKGLTSEVRGPMSEV